MYAGRPSRHRQGGGHPGGGLIVGVMIIGTLMAGGGAILGPLAFIGGIFFGIIFLIGLILQLGMDICNSRSIFAAFWALGWIGAAVFICHQAGVDKLAEMAAMASQ